MDQHPEHQPCERWPVEPPGAVVASREPVDTEETEVDHDVDQQVDVETLEHLRSFAGAASRSIGVVAKMLLPGGKIKDISVSRLKAHAFREWLKSAEMAV